ncbi:MAG: glycosyltransferase [Candidatus Hydrogenedentes bacterium]|nr:glycosyltransferase [Candidatus Hydrogenedentota bacterium]
MEVPDVTVIIHTRNRADLLPVSLAHLEIQTFPAARFEILIVDEGSTDDTRGVLERYTAGAPIRTRCFHDETANTAAAWNRAIEHAAGRWLLFLDDDLLAGPHLIEAHVDAQELAGGTCAVVGHVRPHPQIDPKTFMRWHALDAPYELEVNRPACFLDWRAWNLSLPRQHVLDAGGFAEDPELAGLEDLELAARLEARGLRGLCSEDATAYVWRPAGIEDERRRYYAEGYALHALLERTRSEMARERYLVQRARWRGLLDRLIVPCSRGIYTMFGGHSSPFVLFPKSCLRAAFRKGYRDAVAGRGRSDRP